MHCCQKFILTLPLLLTLACHDQGKDDEDQANDLSKSEISYPDDPAACKAELQVSCADIQNRIEATQEQIKALAESGDMPALYAAQLELNELLEIRDSYQKGNSDTASITQRYTALRELLAANANRPQTMAAVAYQKDELAAVREVFQDLGELYINPSLVVENPRDTTKTITWSAQASGTPWAAYWYPKRRKEMFEADNSPLRKLDRWLTSQNQQSFSATWESNHYDPNAAEWEGLCDAWAIASVSTLEPGQGLRSNEIDFSVSDLKALAIKYYEGSKPKVYGRRYQGVAATDGLIQDLRPEAFHRLMEEYLGKRQQPVIIDEDPSAEVWSKPIFRMAFSISKDPKVPQALLVKAFPWMTRQRTEVNDAPTTIAKDLSAPAYEYRLYYDATTAADGRWKIIAGEWLNSSLNFHPDMVFLPQTRDNQEQPNPEIKKFNAEIHKLLELAGMLKP
jgi:hypothetical protein